MEIGIFFKDTKPAKAQKVAHLVAKGPTHSKGLFFASYGHAIVRPKLGKLPRFCETLRQVVINTAQNFDPNRVSGDWMRNDARRDESCVLAAKEQIVSRVKQIEDQNAISPQVTVNAAKTALLVFWRK